MVRITDAVNPAFQAGPGFHQMELLRRWSLAATDNRQEAAAVKAAILTALDRLHRPGESLRMLDLSSSGLRSLPPTAVLQQLAGISILDLRDNALPGEELRKLSVLTSLTQLYLSDNPLNTIPVEALSHQRHLMILEAHRCGLETFTPELLALSRLDTLGLQGNPLTQLPENLGYCLHDLAELDIRETGITELPSSLQYLYELKVLQ